MSLINVVATAMRLEFNKETNETFLIFKVTDEQFKQEILKDFSKDIELVIRNKKG